MSLLPPQSASKSGYGTLQDSAIAIPKTKPSEVSFFSRLMVGYAEPVLAEGNKRQLNIDDISDVEDDTMTNAAYATFRHHFDRSGGSLVKAILSTYGLSLALGGLAMIFSMACGVFAPVVLNHVIDAFAAPQVAVKDLTVWIVAFFASKIANAFVTTQRILYIEVIALRLTGSLKALLFAKSMRQSIRSRSDPDSIEIINLVTSDVNSVLFAVAHINDLWVLPIQIAVVIYLLHGVIGLAAFAGLAVIVLSITCSMLVARFSSKTFGDIMGRKDSRMKAVKEVFVAIQIVKLNAWETKFAQKISGLRKHELAALSRYVYLRALNTFLLWAAPAFASMVSFSVYSIVLGQHLTAAKVFTAIALFIALRDPIRTLPGLLNQCIQAKVSLERIQNFLVIEEYDSTNVLRDGFAYDHDIAIDITKGSFGWNKDVTVLKNVNMRAKRGDLVVVHGPVGAGKSSLCSVLLGEMEKLSGSVFVRGRVAYYSQQTWIQNITIRENILFGKPYDEALYTQVLDACGLVPDLKQFPAGDLTEIGQKGINLSGGQKARLCLARACYADADVVILDSPMAAVDAIVQREIFGKCICTLLEKKTVVLVTHAPDIIESEAANYKLEVVEGEVTGTRLDPLKRRGLQATQAQPRELAYNTFSSSNAGDGRLVDDEDREEGRVSKIVFWKYFEAIGGLRVCVCVIMVQMLSQALQIASDFWLSYWTGQKTATYEAEAAKSSVEVYLLLGLAGAFMVFLRSVTVSLLGLKASRNLFDAMTLSLLGAPVRFFDANPIGRIINRFGGDMSAVDFRVPFTLGNFLAFFITTLCQLATAIYAVNIVGLLVLPLLYVYVEIGKYYLAPSREVSRLWKVSESPVLSHLTEAEEGVALIRAFGSDYVDRAISENFKRNDVNNKVWFVETAIIVWLELRMQLVGCGVVILVVSALVYLHAFLSPGIVGLAFTYALSVDTGLSDLVHEWASVEISMVSPERIIEYSNIPAEGDKTLLQIEPPAEWPQCGTIEFDNVVFSYKEGGPAVLKGISFSIKSNEKIGIVGRTGAGKSSLTMALFRINELESGRIVIDGRDISKLPLKVLRSHLSIIPQAPVLFKGPLRSFMDPFNDFSDADIWEAFEKVEMKPQIAALDGQLTHELLENGENFSVGERQMLCLARAMLFRSRIVVMDEATASIDHTTEKKLQQVINRDFQEATVLTIAHRLATVVDSDRILVLSDGQVVEFDSPSNLAKNPNGTFHELAREAGVLHQLLIES